MGKKDYIPRSGSARAVWAKTLKENIAANGAAVGFSAGEIAAIEADCQAIIDQINNFAAAKAVYKAASSVKKTTINAAVISLRSKANRAKTHPNYTAGKGKLLGFEAGYRVANERTSKPVLRLSRAPNGWRLAYSRLSNFDGVNIYKRLPGESDFRFIARDNHSPYIDKTPAPTGTAYHAYFLKGDEQIGQQSDEAIIL